jgi:mRNA interferase RelE/StbE
MSNTEHLTQTNLEAESLAQAKQLQAQIQQSLQQLSLERLQAVADFATYLVDTESDAATEELLAIPGLLEKIRSQTAIRRNQYSNWRALRSDVTADAVLAKKIARCLEMLEQTPRSHPNIKALKGTYAGYYRYRVGDYRVIYSVDDQAKQVLVEAIVHRREAYEP